MKVFLSHPMSNIPEDGVLALRKTAEEYLKEKLDEDIEIIENYYHKDAPENAGRLWHLGRSIQQLGEADAVYFCGSFKGALGCVVEQVICRLYDIPVLNDREVLSYGEDRS